MDVTELVTHSIDHADKNTIGDGVSPLDGAPRIVLHGAELGLFVRMPADGSGIEENIGALQSGKARAFGIPLIPADESPHAAVFGIEGFEAKIAGSEIKLFIIKRVIRDVHLAIEALGAPVGVKNDRGIVVE